MASKHIYWRVTLGDQIAPLNLHSSGGNNLALLHLLTSECQK